MGSPEVLEKEGVLGCSITSAVVGLEQVAGDGKMCKDLGDDILEDFESYMEEINGRLTISRMVSDSVIKGIVSAVEKEAAERIAGKELEMACMKEKIQFHNVGSNNNGSLGLSVSHCVPVSVNHVQRFTVKDACGEHRKLREALDCLGRAVEQQFKKFSKEIDGLRGCSSIRRINSGFELVGFGGILNDKESEGWISVDRTLDTLKRTVDAMYNQVNDILQLSEASLYERRQEQEFRAELEGMVIHSFISSLQQQFEEKLDENACLCGSQSVKLFENFDEISTIRKDLSAVLKSLPDQETNHLSPLGSFDMDHVNDKAWNDHVYSSTSLWEGNGKLESKTEVPENFDAAQLKHLNKDEMVSYFNTMMTKMRRDHDSKMQGMAEKLITLKREYYNLRDGGSSLPHKKCKESDVLKKKIPEVILKLDGILLENEKSSISCKNAETIGSLKGRIDSLFCENHKLRNSLRDARNEVNLLSSKFSDSTNESFRHSLAVEELKKLIVKLNSDLADAFIEASVGEEVYKCAIVEMSRQEENLQILIQNLNSAFEDAYINAAVGEDVYKCILKEMSCQIKYETESEEEFSLLKEIYEIILSEAACRTGAACSYDNYGSDLESLIMEGLCGVIFGEIINDAGRKLNTIHAAYLAERESRASIELKALEKESQLRSVVEEKERLKQEVFLLSTLVEKKDKLAMEALTTQMKEQKQFELASQELSSIRNHASQLQILISKKSEEIDEIKIELADALMQIKENKMEISRLNGSLLQAMEGLKEAGIQKNKLHSVIQEKQHELSLIQAKEMKHRTQMGTLVGLVHELSKELADFQCKVLEDLKTKNMRLVQSNSELTFLVKEVNVLGRKGLLYKKRLEKRCTDLQMAEAEVDLLGDEVDALTGLLEKIYFALDHYSPVLKHYPGITEILRLVRRELSGES